MIRAVIGVRYRGPKTWYVKRADKMANYPGAWSLMSIQYEEAELPDPLQLDGARPLFERLAKERFPGEALHVLRHLISGTCSDNPMNERVILHLYHVEFDKVGAPALNSDFYTDAAWLTPEQYQEAAADQLCGLCLRLWSDYLYRTEKVPRFAPQPISDD